MNKKMILGLTAGVLSLSALALVGVSKLNANGFITKADTTATAIYDGTHNTIDSSYVFETNEGWGKEQKATSSTNGYVLTEWYLSEQGGRNYSFGGDSGVFTFERNNNSGWRPSVVINATRLLSIELHFNRDVHLEMYGHGGGDRCERSDAAKSDYVMDYSLVNSRTCTIFFHISGAGATGYEEPVTLESMKVTYDVTACLNGGY